ncbi:MAG: transcriptional regulator [Coriobacteriia bacterium]|nr:transcriptional regulator [Coriobacteriia bacterium]
MMDLFRIGDKVISKRKIDDALKDLLMRRANGATQKEAAAAVRVPRTFVSNVETLGTIRTGKKIAFIAFPLSNAAEATALAEHYGIDLTLVFSQTERKHVEEEPASDIFNRMIDTIAALKSFDAAVIAASDYRIETFRNVLDLEVIGLPLGKSPLLKDQELDLGELEELFIALTTKTDESSRKTTAAYAATGEGPTGFQIAKRWLSSKK